jgi:hypothetical protein
MMLFKTAIVTAALGAMLLPGSAMLFDSGAGAADLYQIRRVSKPGLRVASVESRYYGPRRYYPAYIDAGAYDREFARAYWLWRAESPYRPMPWYLR